MLLRDFNPALMNRMDIFADALDTSFEALLLKACGTLLMFQHVEKMIRFRGNSRSLLYLVTTKDPMMLGIYHISQVQTT